MLIIHKVVRATFKASSSPSNLPVKSSSCLKSTGQTFDSAHHAARWNELKHVCLVLGPITCCLFERLEANFVFVKLTDAHA